MQVVNDTSETVDYSTSGSGCNRNLKAGHYEPANVSGTVAFYNVGGSCQTGMIDEVTSVPSDAIVLLTMEGGNKKAKTILRN